MYQKTKRNGQLWNCDVKSILTNIV